jgi:quinol monooxygenase YgiN
MSDAQDIHLVAECRAKPGQEDALRKAVHAAVAPSRGDPGVLSYTVHEDTKQPGHFFFVEHYASREALKAHMDQPHFKTLVAETKDKIEGEFKMSLLRPVE